MHTMEITCVNCKQAWQPSAAQVLAAKIKFGLGFVEHTFTCPNCHTRNLIPETEFEKSDHPKPLVPVTGDQTQLDIQPEHDPPRAENDRSRAPLNPVPGPDPNGRQVHAVVLERGLPLLREPNPMAETGFDEKPDDTSKLLREFAAEGLVNIVGGCCGTTPEHIAAIRQQVEPLAARGVQRAFFYPATA